jgi:DnaJ-class molecular chaperone
MPFSKPKFEKVPTSSNYPRPKRNEEVKCLACNKGKVMGPCGVIKDCKACHGKGTITAK